MTVVVFYFGLRALWETFSRHLGACCGHGNPPRIPFLTAPADCCFEFLESGENTGLFMDLFGAADFCPRQTLAESFHFLKRGTIAEWGGK